MNKHYDQISRLGCILCRHLGYPHDSGVEIHHIRRHGMKRDNAPAIPLCLEHHRGATGIHGLGIKRFEREYNVTQEELLEKLNLLLSWHTLLFVSKMPVISIAPEGIMSEKKAKRPKAGRPAHEVDESSKRLIKNLAGIGLTQEQIAARLGISADTLSKYYSKEWEIGKAEAISIIAGSLFQKAKAGDNSCMMFYLKTQGRWKENHDDTNANGEKVIVIKGGFQW